jgi:hypothetical protein
MNGESVKKMLQNYYDAMNLHDMDLILSFLADDIHVSFKEESRNWKGKEMARSKFGLMYERNPKFKGEIVTLGTPFAKSEVLDSSVNVGVVSKMEIQLVARFGSVDSMEDANLQTMVYTVDEGLRISSIHHT